MKKFALLVVAFLMVGHCFLPLRSFSVSADSFPEQEPITCQTATYVKDSDYKGKKVAPHLDVASFATLEVSGSGGTHIDGEGDLVFSNVVSLNLTLNFDRKTKMIANTGVKVSDDTCDWNDMNRENDYKYDDSTEVTEKPISYGAISVIRTDNEGHVEKYAPIFSTGNTYVELYPFNVDGDYTIFVFFETIKNGKYQNHIISFSFKIRSYVYLLDEETGFQIKNSGISGKSILLDSQNRQGVVVEMYRNNNLKDTYDGQDFNGNIRISEDGTYKFIVRNKGFVCEVFYFIIDSQSEDRKIFFDNLCRQLGEYRIGNRIIYSYEAEKYFWFTWDDNDPNPVLKAEYALLENSEDESAYVEYTKETLIETPGIYVVKASFATATSVTYYIQLLPEAAPSHNYEKLTANRFNTFKTKWWQVENNLDGRVFCFDFDTERDRAYNAAMTIENSSVQDDTGRYYFRDNWYNDRIELTAAMNEYVFANNLKTVYYDPNDYANDEESLRTFSSQSFDSCIYLNDEFQFVSNHPAEVAKVKAVAKDGAEYEIAFSVPISEQNLPDGEYTITETDKYGNETFYTAYRDKSAPVVRVRSENQIMTIEDGAIYTCADFSIASFEDTFDPWSVLKIEFHDHKSYYIQDEYEGITFQNKGTYTLSAYDRNGNSVTCTIVNR